MFHLQIQRLEELEDFGHILVQTLVLVVLLHVIHVHQLAQIHGCAAVTKLMVQTNLNIHSNLFNRLLNNHELLTDISSLTSKQLM